MFRKKYLVLAVLGTVLALSACSKKKNSVLASAGQDATGSAANQSAQSYAANDNQSFQGEDGMYAAVNNQMKAPSNQTYYFDFDSNMVNVDMQKFIDQQADYLFAHPNVKVRLEGNTDNRGSREYNVGLGWKRDKSVARLLQQKGVRPSQIDMVSYGKEKPAVLGNNEQAWHLNRRVNLVYEATS